MKDSDQQAFGEKVNAIEDIVIKHEWTRKSSTYQLQLEHKLCQLDSKFEAQQVSGSIGEMKKTNTAKFEVMLLKPHQLSLTPEKLKPSSA